MTSFITASPLIHGCGQHSQLGLDGDYMKKILLIISVLLWSAVGFGETYYVKPSSVYPAVEDSIGTPTAPYDTPAKSSDIRTVFVYARTNATEDVVLVLLNGTIDLSVPDLTYYVWNVAHSLTIQPDSGAISVIDGKTSHAFLQFASATKELVISGIEIKNCIESPSSSRLTALYVNGATKVTFSNGVKFTSCTAATEAGGAVYIYNAGEFTSSGTTYNGNSSATFSGAVQISTCPIFSSQNDIYSNNEAPSGGALYFTNVARTSVAFSTCVFSSNTATTGHGGALYILDFNNPLTVTGSTFDSNSAFLSGGAIRTSNTGTNDITDSCVFTDNSVFGLTGGTTFQGGAVILVGENVNGTISDTTFSGNNSDYTGSAGGGLKLSAGAYAEIYRCTFSGNSATSGGGIDFGGSTGVACTSVLALCLFDGNTGNLGAAWNALTVHTVIAYNNTYINNVRTDEGGVINMSGTVDTTMINEIVSNGGVNEIRNNRTGTVILDHSYVEDNAITGEEPITPSNAITGDPLLTSVGKLQSGSSCIKAGTEADVVGLTGSQTDIFGNTEIFEDRYNLNIGADLEKYGLVSPHIIGGKILGGKFVD